MVPLEVKRLRPDSCPPRRMSDEAAGLDLAAALDEPLAIKPGEWATIPTGIAIAVPRGFEGQVRPRSGLAAKHAVTCLNSPGTIDSDYRGEVKIIMVNHGREPFVVRHGERIAQLVIAPVVSVEVKDVEELSSTQRGERGFGSSGT